MDWTKLVVDRPSDHKQPSDSVCSSRLYTKDTALELVQQMLANGMPRDPDFPTFNLSYEKHFAKTSSSLSIKHTAKMSTEQT
jgi:hypothetical protein